MPPLRKRMINSQMHWQQAEVDFLIANMETMKMCDLIHRLGRSHNSITSKLKRIRADGLINCRKRSSKYI